MRGIFRKIIALTAASAAIAVAASSCNNDGCTDSRSSVPLASFADAANGKAITLDSLQIHGIGAPGDSILYKAGDKISQANLPMRSTRTQTSWCFSYKWKALDYAALNDTVTIDYTSQPFLAGDECGAMYNYTITGVTHTSHIIDSIKVAQPFVTNIGVTNLTIYFRTEGGGAEQ